MAGPLEGRTCALIGQGTPLDRAVALALAENGANVALATVRPSEEFAVASIANEVWAIGRKQFSLPIQADRAVDVESFANECIIRLGGCDGLILGLGAPYTAIDAFLAAIPTARVLWLARDNIGEGAVHVAATAGETSARVLASLISQFQDSS